MYKEMLEEFDTFCKEASNEDIEKCASLLLAKIADDLDISLARPRDYYYVKNMLNSLPSASKPDLKFRYQRKNILSNVKKGKNVYVAKLDGNIAGLAKKKDRPNHAVLLENIIEMPEYKDKKVSEQLLKHVLDTHPYVRFKTKKGDTANIELAKNHGFDLIRSTLLNNMVWEKIKTIENKNKLSDQYQEWLDWTDLPKGLRQLSDKRLKNKLGVTNEELHKLILDSSEIRRRGKISNLFTVQPKPEITEKLIKASDDLLTLNIKYIDRKGVVTAREVEPYEIRDNKFWGYDVEKDGIRQFNLERIMDAKPSGKPFSPRFDLKMR